ncbi:hypothetical protein [Amycolatopsis albispora]|uniref:hypothetical protein n=1 Tax=Amycolatopsis albispora TaxID=1804986 RepID=UPI0013B3A276|nr:hypothetical protein [Amycolatopsis albispora]
MTHNAAGPVATAHHHGSHRHLLRTAEAGNRTAPVDAIIVPTARHGSALRPAIELAARLDCTLVTLCSKWSSADTIADLAERRGTGLLAIETEHLRPAVLPAFRTSELLRGQPYERREDTSDKRNLGLLLARLAGWERVVFLDDDILVPDAADLERAAALTEDHAGVGLAIGGYPDNSVVCHAYREAGGKQDTFIGGGALAVGRGSLTSFFPNIYNEDWFFLLNEHGLGRTAVAGHAVQKEYDPFAHELRARLEELGDCLAEGLFWLLDTEGTIQRAGRRGYWRDFLDRREKFISEVIAMVTSRVPEDARRARMLKSLKAARGRCQIIPPELCVDYVGAWREDRHSWRSHSDDLDRQAGVARGVRIAVKVLGLEGLTTRVAQPVA